MTHLTKVYIQQGTTQLTRVVRTETRDSGQWVCVETPGGHGVRWFTAAQIHAWNGGAVEVLAHWFEAKHAANVAEGMTQIRPTPLLPANVGLQAGDLCAYAGKLYVVEYATGSLWTRRLDFDKCDVFAGHIPSWMRDSVPVLVRGFWDVPAEKTATIESVLALGPEPETWQRYGDYDGRTAWRRVS